MKIDPNWLKQHAAAFMIVALLLSYIIGHDPKVPIDVAHRFELAFGALTLLAKIVFPASVPQFEHVLKALQGAGLVPATDPNPTTESQPEQSDQQTSS